MICYTNHALDQFLTSIIQKLSLIPGQVVRVGGRSAHPEMQPFLIQKLRQHGHDSRTRGDNLAQRYEILGSIKRQLEECSKNYTMCCEKILGIDQLCRIMDKEQILSLIEPVLSQLDIFNTHWNKNAGGLYCCSRAPAAASTDSSTSDEEESEASVSDDEDESPLSDYEKCQRMKNRIHCDQLNKLSTEDQTVVNQLFIKWLDAAQIETIIRDIQEQVDGQCPMKSSLSFEPILLNILLDDGAGEFTRVENKRKDKHREKARHVLKGMRVCFHHLN